VAGPDLLLAPAEPPLQLPHLGQPDQLGEVAKAAQRGQRQVAELVVRPLSQQAGVVRTRTVVAWRLV
jgi:hypothetical protein